MSEDDGSTTSLTKDGKVNATKFNVDRSEYNDKLAGWFAHQFAGRSDVSVTDLDIPVSTGFSNETVMFTVNWT